MNYRFISAETGASLGAANQTKPNQNPNRGEEASPLTKRGYSLPITSRGGVFVASDQFPAGWRLFFIEILTLSFQHWCEQVENFYLYFRDGFIELSDAIMRKSSSRSEWRYASAFSCSVWRKLLSMAIRCSLW